MRTIRLFPGLYTDPEILYAEQTGRYYLYPATDGEVGWNNRFPCLFVR